MNQDLFYQHKLQEQVEALNAELDALRHTVKEQYKALVIIYGLRAIFVDGRGSYHYIFRHVGDQLDAVFKTALNRIGR
jgi:hypothetical protein